MFDTQISNYYVYICSRKNKLIKSMEKAVIWARVSTVQQEVEQQVTELSDLARREGYEDIKVIKASGASAIKQNELYEREVEALLDALTDKDIKAVYVWEISRLARNESVFYKMKDALIKGKVQFICLNPQLRLLDPDGSVNSGAELTMALLITLAKQEMELKVKRFKRAKAVYAEEGRYVGGKLLYGYKVESGYYVENKEEADVIRLIYNLYSQPHSSVDSVAKEINARGYKLKYVQVRQILKNTAYTGHRARKLSHKYPVIIPSELYKKVQEKKRTMYKDATKTHNYLAAGVLKCPVCGSSFVANSTGQYICVKHANNYKGEAQCNYKRTVNIRYLDSILWAEAKDLEMRYRLQDAFAYNEKCRQQIEILQQKKEASKTDLQGIKTKLSRIAEAYIDGLIDKNQRDTKVQNVKKEEQEIRDNISAYTTEIQRLTDLISTEQKQDYNDLINKSIDGITDANYKGMHDLVLKHIRSVKFERIKLMDTLFTRVDIYPYISDDCKTYYVRQRPKQGADMVYWDVTDEDGNYLPADLQIIR